MLTSDDRIRVSQSALAKAGRLGMGRALRGDERLTQVLKYMAEHSALASGRRRDGYTPGPGKRRRYGDVVLVLRAGTVVDIAVTRPDYCRACFGAHCVSPGHCPHSTSRRVS